MIVCPGPMAAKQAKVTSNMHQSNALTVREPFANPIAVQSETRGKVVCLLNLHTGNLPQIAWAVPEVQSGERGMK